MRYVSLGEVVRLHQLLIESSGGAAGTRGTSQSDLAKCAIDGHLRSPLVQVVLPVRTSSAER